MSSFSRTWDFPRFLTIHSGFSCLYRLWKELKASHQDESYHRRDAANQGMKISTNCWSRYFQYMTDLFILTVYYDTLIYDSSFHHSSFIICQVPLSSSCLLPSALTPPSSRSAPSVVYISSLPTPCATAARRAQRCRLWK